MEARSCDPAALLSADLRTTSAAAARTRSRPPLVYLDSAATALKPLPVIQA